MSKSVRILGTRGVPAAHGGFETAIENIGLALADRGWRVVVYCQTEGRGPVQRDVWRGIERVLVPTPYGGWKGTVHFDWRSIRHAAKARDLCLTMGYNTALFNSIQWAKRIPNVINMDGIEWRRSRWGLPGQAFLFSNEFMAARIGTHLIADHPQIETYLSRIAPRRKISTIAYGAPAISQAPIQPVVSLGLAPGRYSTVICRPIVENSMLEIVTAFSRERRDHNLVVLGNYDADSNAYHREVIAAASDEVLFPGAIYDPATVSALRCHSTVYVHGHTVGGTNPSLVEALGAGNPVIAHDNVYNRWVAGDEAARFFTGTDDLADIFTDLLARPDLLTRMSAASRARHAAEFTWDRISDQYEELLTRCSGG